MALKPARDCRSPLLLPPLRPCPITLGAHFFCMDGEPESASEGWSATTGTGVAALSATAWDACAGGDNPFVSHAFLSAAEDSGCAVAGAGWQPMPVLLRDRHGHLAAAAPVYIKAHSYGEYVFDHGWADAWSRAGGRYYPKLQLSVPFTPATGPRLLIRESGAVIGGVGAGGSKGAMPALILSPTSARQQLIAAMTQAVQRFDLSSAHATFLNEADRVAFLAAGWLLRQGVQYHWENQGYGSFDDFLAALSSRKRKMIRKEREQAAASGVEIVALCGDDIKEQHWDAFFQFYMDTADRKWGMPYLNRAFFRLIGERMAERVVLFMGRKDGAFVAGALNFLGADTLYGRNWGCLGAFKFLHFEACYYRAIEFAIANRLARVEAGAQGPHKIQRGYLPTAVWSAHHIPDPAFRRAVADFLARETKAIEAQMQGLAELGPYREVGEGRPACDRREDEGGA